MLTSKFIHELKLWFKEEKRNLPWRQNVSPYAVWVSEVMLQQTRASVVVPYFLRWMDRFPNIKVLADADIEEVIKVWEGLGYYSRARALHEGANYFSKHFGGSLPSKREELEKVKGLGPYTIGAILSFAFHQKAAAIDGNVLRVITRLFCIEEEVSQASVKRRVMQIVEDFLPDREPWVVMEALIELGASICIKTPNCRKCPMQERCLGFERGKVDLLPKRKKRPKMTLLKREVFVITHKGHILIQKNKGNRVMSGLYEFPYVEYGAPHPFEKLILYKKLKEVKHRFTRYEAHLFPSIWEGEEEIDGTFFIEKKKLKTLPFSSGHRQILAQVLEEYAYTTH